MSTYPVKNLVPVILVLYLCLFFTINGLPRESKTCKFDQIYQLGDSLSDTGNSFKLYPMSSTSKLPYGQNFPQNATGRFSNGRLMIATAAGLPFLVPYMSGANFAVGALPGGMWQSSLNVQLDWMTSLFKSVFRNQQERVEKLRRALFMFGEIGGNDYNFAISAGKSMDELKGMVPDVVAAIIKGVEEAISFGATTLMVPGNFPMGCLTFLRATFRSNTTYDEFQCIQTLNEFTSYHNEQLQLGIQKLIKEHKTESITVIYGDYYKAYESLLQIFKSRGSDTKKACCGIGGEYNYSPMKMCGGDGVPVCKYPDKYISWDGVHLTQEAYKIMAASLVSDLCKALGCNGLQGR